MYPSVRLFRWLGSPIGAGCTSARGRLLGQEYLPAHRVHDEKEQSGFDTWNQAPTESNPNCSICSLFKGKRRDTERNKPSEQEDKLPCQRVPASHFLSLNPRALAGKKMPLYQTCPPAGGPKTYHRTIAVTLPNISYLCGAPNRARSRSATHSGAYLPVSDPGFHVR